jgi:hypothetical protein
MSTAVEDPTADAAATAATASSAIAPASSTLQRTAEEHLAVCHKLINAGLPRLLRLNSFTPKKSSADQAILVHFPPFKRDPNNFQPPHTVLCRSLNDAPANGAPVVLSIFTDEERKINDAREHPRGFGLHSMNHNQVAQLLIQIKNPERQKDVGRRISAAAWRELTVLCSGAEEVPQSWVKLGEAREKGEKTDSGSALLLKRPKAICPKAFRDALKLTDNDDTIRLWAYAFVKAARATRDAYTQWAQGDDVAFLDEIVPPYHYDVQELTPAELAKVNEYAATLEVPLVPDEFIALPAIIPQSPLSKTRVQKQTPTSSGGKTAPSPHQPSGGAASSAAGSIPHLEPPPQSAFRPLNLEQNLAAAAAAYPSTFSRGAIAADTAGSRAPSLAPSIFTSRLTAAAASSTPTSGGGGAAAASSSCSSSVVSPLTSAEVKMKQEKDERTEHQLKLTGQVKVAVARKRKAEDFADEQLNMRALNEEQVERQQRRIRELEARVQEANARADSSDMMDILQELQEAKYNLVENLDDLLDEVNHLRSPPAGAAAAAAGGGASAAVHPSPSTDSVAMEIDAFSSHADLQAQVHHLQRQLAQEKALRTLDQGLHQQELQNVRQYHQQELEQLRQHHKLSIQVIEQHSVRPPAAGQAHARASSVIVPGAAAGRPSI